MTENKAEKVTEKMKTKPRIGVEVRERVCITLEGGNKEILKERAQLVGDYLGIPDYSLSRYLEDLALADIKGFHIRKGAKARKEKQPATTQGYQGTAGIKKLFEERQAQAAKDS